MIFADFNISTLEVGQVMGGRLTVTESHIVLASGIFADYAPLHTDEEFSNGTQYGTRTAHEMLVLGIMGGVVGKALGANALGYVEQSSQFFAPVFAGDTISTSWEVREKLVTPDSKGGVVKLAGVCTSQKDEVVARAELSLMVS
jgi:3-hydroxybutyryl-CoA dehydratase